VQAVAVVTLVIAALVVATAALALVRVILHLRATLATLDDVAAGVQVIAEKTSTVPTVVPSVNSSLKPVRDFCESI